MRVCDRKFRLRRYFPKRWGFDWSVIAGCVLLTAGAMLVAVVTSRDRAAEHRSQSGPAEGAPSLTVREEPSQPSHDPTPRRAMQRRPEILENRTAKPIIKLNPEEITPDIPKGIDQFTNKNLLSEPFGISGGVSGSHGDPPEIFARRGAAPGPGDGRQPGPSTPKGVESSNQTFSVGGGASGAYGNRFGHGSVARNGGRVGNDPTAGLPPATGGGRPSPWSGEGTGAKAADEAPFSPTARVDQILASLRPLAGETPGAMFFRYWGDNPFVLVETDPLSTFATDVDTASYTLTRAYLGRGVIPPRAAIRTEEFVNAFASNYAPPATGDFGLHLEMAPSPFGKRGTQVVKVGVKAREVSPELRTPLALTLVIDVSGSMKQGNRLELVKDAIRILVGQLDERDSVGIVVFTTQARDVLQPVRADRSHEILEALRPLRPLSSTNVQHGLTLGYAMAGRHHKPHAINCVVLFSDGVANTGDTTVKGMLARIDSARREQGIYLNTFGVGMGNHNDALLEQLADRGDGQCAYLDTLEEANRLFRQRLLQSFEVVARDCKIQVQFDPTQVLAYRQIGYENRAVADRDFRNDMIDAGEVCAGHEVVALYEVELRPGAGGTGSPAPVTMRLRYQPVKGGEVQELVQQLEPAGIAVYHAAPPRFRLSVMVAAFAELLRDSYWSRETRMEELVERSRSLLVLDSEGNTSVSELVALMEQSRRLLAARTRSQETRVLDELRRNHFLRARLATVIDRDASDRERRRQLREELQHLESDNRELESRIRQLLLGEDC